MSKQLQETVQFCAIKYHKTEIYLSVSLLPSFEIMRNKSQAKNKFDIKTKFHKCLKNIRLGDFIK